MARKGKVAVIGAGFYGSTTAQRLAEYDIFDEVVLTDIIEGKPEGLALDMNQSRPVEGFETKLTGQTTGLAGEGYEAIAGSGIVIVTAGLPRKPGMSRMDLIEVNAKIVRSVVENVVKQAPEAVLIVVSNPLDEMTALAAKVSGFPSRRVMGQAGMLDTARFSYFVAERLGVPVSSVRTLTLGSHGDTMVPVPSACSVDGVPLADRLPAADIDALVERTRQGGAEIVALLKTGSAYYAPSAAAARMARAVAGRRVRHLRCLPGRGGRTRGHRGAVDRYPRPDRAGAGGPAGGGRRGAGEAGLGGQPLTVPSSWSGGLAAPGLAAPAAPPLTARGGLRGHRALRGAGCGGDPRIRMMVVPAMPVISWMRCGLIPAAAAARITSSRWALACAQACSSASTSSRELGPPPSAQLTAATLLAGAARRMRGTARGARPGAWSRSGPCSGGCAGAPGGGPGSAGPGP